jgi:hypothetical protein
LSWRNAWKVAIAMIQTSETGIRPFQPSFMNWSYRNRGSVPRSQTNSEMNNCTLITNQIGPNHGLLSAGSTVSASQLTGQIGR